MSAKSAPAAPATKKPAAKPAAKPKVAFPKKAQPPTEAEFVARLPLATGKRFEALRGFLKKQKGVVEELFYFGPKTGWAYRYLRGASSAQPQGICSITILADRLLGIVSLDEPAIAAVAWDQLSPIAQRARRTAHGSPARLWLDVPLDGPGASDFKAILRAKLKAMPASPPGPASPAAPTVSV